MLREDATVESLEARPNARFRYCLQAGAIHAEWTLDAGAALRRFRRDHEASGTVGDRLAGLLAGPGGDALARVTETHLRGLSAALRATRR